MTLARHCKDGSLLRIEIDVYKHEQGHLVVAFDMQCPIDNFETTLACFKAALNHLGKQIKEQRKCPWHPDNNKEDKSHDKQVGPTNP